MKPLRLFFIDPAPLEGGRTESLQFLQLADALAQQGAKVTLVTPRTPWPEDLAAILGRPIAAGLNSVSLADPRRSLLYRIFGLGRSNKPFFASLRRWLGIHGKSADFLYVRNLKLAESLLQQRELPPIYYHAHEHFARVFAESHVMTRWKNQRKLSLLKRREAFVCRRSAGIIATVWPIVEDIRADYGADIPALVVANGVDLALVQDDHFPIGNNSRITALYLGSLHPWKGIETVLHAMPAVGATVDLIIAGGEARRIAALEKLAASLGIVERVQFLGAVAPANRFALIARADIALLPLTERSGMASRYTSPLKLYEYMALGRAILASDLPSVREVVRDGYEARLVAPDAPEAWAQALALLAGDAEARRQLGENARQTARSCSWAARAETILNWLQKRISEENNYP